MQQIIETNGGSRAVVICSNDPSGPFWACLYVNARKGIQDADITPIRWQGKTLAGAKKWAAKQLAA
jgi:hypothetical protein